MNRIIIAVFIAAVALASPVQGALRIVPVVGHTDGAFGTYWRSDLLLSNAAGQAQVVTLRFYPTGSAPVTRSIALAGSDTMVVPDVVNPASFGLEPRSWLGQLVIDSPQGVHASAHTWTTSPLREGTYGSTIASYDPITVPTHGLATGLVVSAAFRSNVAFANSSASGNALGFWLRDDNGNLVAGHDLFLAPHETRQISVSQDLGLPHGTYSVEWTSNVPAIAVVSVIDNRSGDPSNAPSIANARATLCFPIVGRTEGAFGTAWTTSLSVTPESPAVTPVTLSYHGGQDVEGLRTTTIPSRGTFFVEDVLEFLGVPSGIGFLHISSDAPMVASARIFHTEEDGATYGSLLLPQEPMAESDVVRIRGVRRTAEFRANVALTNRTQESTAGWLRFFDHRGDLAEKHWFVLKAHETIQVSLNGSLVDVEAGEVEVMTGGGVPILVIVSNVDNASGDTLVREADQEIERQLEP